MDNIYLTKVAEILERNECSLEEVSMEKVANWMNIGKGIANFGKAIGGDGMKSALKASKRNPAKNPLTLRQNLGSKVQRFGQSVITGKGHGRMALGIGAGVVGGYAASKVF